MGQVMSLQFCRSVADFPPYTEMLGGKYAVSVLDPWKCSVIVYIYAQIRGNRQTISVTD